MTAKYVLSGRRQGENWSGMYGKRSWIKPTRRWWERHKYAFFVTRTFSSFVHHFACRSRPISDWKSSVQRLCGRREHLTTKFQSFSYNLQAALAIVGKRLAYQTTWNMQKLWEKSEVTVTDAAFRRRLPHSSWLASLWAIKKRCLRHK